MPSILASSGRSLIKSNVDVAVRTGNNVGKILHDGFILGPGFRKDIEIGKHGGPIDIDIEFALACRGKFELGEMQANRIARRRRIHRYRVSEISITLGLVNSHWRGIRCLHIDQVFRRICRPSVISNIAHEIRARRLPRN